MTTAPEFTAAGIFLDTMVAGDFAQLSAALEPDATMKALLPRGYDEWSGSADVCAAFERFFGGMDEYAVVDASVGHVGARLQLRWRLQVRGGRLGPEQYVVEQHCYADPGPTGRIQHMSLVCSGFCREPESITSTVHHEGEAK